MLRLMPLPGDPVIEVEKDINEDTEENAFRWWKMQVNLKVKWPEWKQEIIEKHYRHEWEEMRKKAAK